ncbi:MAG: DNA gyrase inhibitor YacG [Betaproteobacteria bacterium]
MVTVVKCPACAAPVPWTESSRWRPFCSERCRLIDLGDWAAERHRIAGEPADDLAADTPTPPKPH